jgi:hypothetical protein
MLINATTSIIRVMGWFIARTVGFAEDVAFASDATVQSPGAIVDRRRSPADGSETGKTGFDTIQACRSVEFGQFDQD